MTSHGVLQSIDVNLRSVDQSPARKRARYTSPDREHWSINKNSLLLDEIYECGLGLLDSESDNENSPVKTEHVSNKQSLKNAKDSGIISFGKLQQTSHKPVKDYYNAANINYFDRLSDEVILYIFHCLPKRFLTSIAFVCRRWYRLTQDESLWSRMDISSKNLQPGAIGHILSRQVVILRLLQSHIASPVIQPGCRASLPEFKGRLSYLDLSMAHISFDALITIFNKCTKLKKLSLENVAVNADVMKALSQSIELEVLNLSLAEGLDLAGVTSLLSSCQKLRELNLAWTYLTSACIDYICCNLPESLYRLNMAGCRKLISDKNVLDIISCCSGLRELDLSDSTGLTGESVYHITLLDDLNFLALSRCYLIPYRALLELKKMHSLMYLDVHGAYINAEKLRIIQDHLGPKVNINKFKFSSVARPTVGSKYSSIWNLRVRD